MALQVVPVIIYLPCLESYPKHVRDKNSVKVSYNELHSLGEKWAIINKFIHEWEVNDMTYHTIQPMQLLGLCVPAHY